MIFLNKTPMMSTKIPQTSAPTVRPTLKAVKMLPYTASDIPNS